MTFASSNKDVLPPDIVTLLEAHFIDPQTVISPFPRARVPAGFDKLTREQKVQWVEQNGPYVYAAAGKRGVIDPQTVLFYGKPRDHPNGILVAYGDAHSEWLEQVEAMRLIERLKGGQ